MNFIKFSASDRVRWPAIRALTPLVQENFYSIIYEKATLRTKLVVHDHYRQASTEKIKVLNQSVAQQCTSLQDWGVHVGYLWDVFNFNGCVQVFAREQRDGQLSLYRILKESRSTALVYKHKQNKNFPWTWSNLRKQGWSQFFRLTGENFTGVFWGEQHPTNSCYHNVFNEPGSGKTGFLFGLNHSRSWNGRAQ